MVRVVPIAGGVRLTPGTQFSPYGVSQPDKWHVPVCRCAGPMAARCADTARAAEGRFDGREADQRGRRPDRVADAELRHYGYYAWSMPDSMLRSLASSAGGTELHEQVCFPSAISRFLARPGDVHGDTYLRGGGALRERSGPQVLTKACSAAFSPMRAARSCQTPQRRHSRNTCGRRWQRRRSSGSAWSAARADELLGTIRNDLMTWLAQTWRRRPRTRSLSSRQALRPTRRAWIPASWKPCSWRRRRVMPRCSRGSRIAQEVATVPAMKRRYLGTLGAFGHDARARAGVHVVGPRAVVRPCW